MPRHRLAPFLVAFLALLAAPEARLSGQAAPDGASEVDDARDWAFFFNLGAGGLSGEFDAALGSPWVGEYGLRRIHGPWWYGLGLSFTSFALKPPYANELEFGFQRTFLTGGRTFGSGTLRPFAEGRVGLARLHPRSGLFAFDPLPPDFNVGDSPTPSSNGFFVGAGGGVDWRLSRSLSLEAGLFGSWAHVGDTDLTAVGQNPASSVVDWHGRLGLAWRTGPAPGAPVERTVWDVRPSWAWAFGEAFAINFAASGINEYVRNANFNQISPRSWWSNVEEGFTYDDNDFVTNQFIHPFNGSQYYNAARSNGLPFWDSYAVAMLGAWHWELAGETHPQSFNDLVATGVGGAAGGEIMFRFSSMMLDNQATGGRRLVREASAFLVDPIRGFNRLLTGRAWRVHANPQDAIDRNPLGQVNASSLGWRRVADGSNLEKDGTDLVFLEYVHQHGNVFDNPRRGAFDYFTFEGQLNFGRDRTIGRVMIEGNLLTTPIGEARPANHMFGLVQHFQYNNNNAYEYGGQSFGPSVFSRWGRVGRFGLETRLDMLATLMGAVNSEAAGLANVADPERLREYDYGPGGGGNAEVVLTFDRSPLVTLRYKLHYITTVNGSVYHQENELGLTSRHWLSGADVRVAIPLHPDWALGARYSTFTRRSRYDLEVPQSLPPDTRLSALVKQTNPELRIYVSFLPSIWG